METCPAALDTMPETEKVSTRFHTGTALKEK